MSWTRRRYTKNWFKWHKTIRTSKEEKKETALALGLLVFLLGLFVFLRTRITFFHLGLLLKELQLLQAIGPMYSI